MMTQLQRLWIQITSDRRRFGLLCAVFAVALLLWARIIVISKPPRTAVADAPDIATESTAVSELNQPDNGSDETVRIWLHALPDRNPFAIDAEFFPNPTDIGDNRGDGSKSDEDAAEEAVRLANRELERLEELVALLKLEAVVKVSDSSMAVINGKMYRVGATIVHGSDRETTFELVEVGDRTAAVKHDEHRFELRMPLPGEGSQEQGAGGAQNH